MATLRFMAALLVLPLLATAAEVKVISTVAAKSTLEALKPMFERSTPHTLDLTFGTALPLKRRIEAGEAFDVTILTPPMVEDLANSGKVDAGSKVDVARSGLALAGPRDAPAASIATADSLKRALVSAKGVAYTKEGQSGIAAARLIERLGLSEELKPKIVLETRTGGSLMAIEEGKADLGFALVSEVLSTPGVTFLGPLPAELQSYMVLTAGTSPSAKDAAASKAFVDFLRSEEARAVMKTRGMEGL